MAISFQGKRRVVVQGSTWIYRAEFGYDQLFTDGGGVLIVRDDRKVRITVSSYRALLRGCYARVYAPELPWFAGLPRATIFVLPMSNDGLWMPGAIAKVIAWCLDPRAEHIAVPNPWAPKEAPLPDESTAEGFAARLLHAPERDLQRAIEVAEEVLDRPLEARPLDPTARDLERSRRLVQRVWETLATRKVIPDAWADGAMRFVASTERALPGEGDAIADGLVALRTPPSLRCALALASDVAGVTRAEAIALEGAARFETLCEPVFHGESRALWSVARDRYARGASEAPGAHTASSVVSEALLRSMLGDGMTYDEILRGEHAPGWGIAPATVVTAALNDRELARRWSVARERGMSLTAEPGVALDRVGYRFDALADPYATLLSLWRSGYGLEAFSLSGALLVAPDVPFE